MQIQAEQTARQRIWYFDITLSSIYIFILATGLLMAIKEEPCGSYKMWIQVCCGLYIADLTISMN